MRRSIVHFSAVALGALLLSSCTGMKYATEAKPMFTGFTVEWTEPPVQDRKQLTHELEGLVKPTPNNSILGMRPTVALHNMVKEPKEPKGLGNLLRNKIGSAPVYLTDVPLPDIKAAIANRLNNHGYFAAEGDFTIKRKGRKATVTFTATPGTPHRYRNIVYGDSTSKIDRQVARAQQDSPLRSGELYDLAKLTDERFRVTKQLRNRGWYKLKDNDLEFTADTSVGDHRLDLALRVKPATDEQKRAKYTLGDIYVHGDHDEFLTPNDTRFSEQFGMVV